MALTAYSKYRLYITRTSTSPVNKPYFGAVNSFHGFSAGDGSGSNLLTGGTASASSTYSSNNASNAFDANAYSYWEAGNQSDAFQWVRMDLASPVTIRNFYISSQVVTEVPRDFKIQGSDDGTNWTDLVTVVDWVTAVTAKTGSWRVDLLLSGTSLLDTGGGASKVFIHKYSDGELVGVATPHASTGAWSVRPQFAGEVLITHIGTSGSGFRPVTDGPVTPATE